MARGFTYPLGNYMSCSSFFTGEYAAGVRASAIGALSRLGANHLLGYEFVS